MVCKGGDDLLAALQTGNYQPQAVKLAEILKPNGGIRKLGIPTVTDRIIQQAIAQVLSRYTNNNFLITATVFALTAALTKR